jgi:hypothetical protein
MENDHYDIKALADEMLDKVITSLSLPPPDPAVLERLRVEVRARMENMRANCFAAGNHAFWGGDKSQMDK